MTKTTRSVLFFAFGLVGCGQAGPESVPSQEPDVAIEESGVEGSADALAAGPMLGAVTATTARIWAYAGGSAALEVRYRKLGTQAWTIVPMPAPKADRYAGEVQLTSLSAATVYEYQVHVKAQPWSLLSTLKTAPAHAPGKFRFAFGSCYAKGDDPTQPSWKLVQQEAPDFYIHLGDTVYLPSDPTDYRNRDPEVMWEHHVGARNIPTLATFMRSVPNYAIWDDHDFGPNNSGGEMIGDRKGDRVASLDVWSEVWANPSAGLPGVPGIFFEFAWRDADFFMLDCRYYRNGGPSGTDKGTQIFGPGQLKWLIDGLSASSAPFKFLACGTPSGGWDWGLAERNKLMTAINQKHIEGVIIMSGDPHRVSLRSSAGWSCPGGCVKPAYPIFDAVSSGLGITLAPPTRGYGVFEVDTSLADPTATVRLVAGNGATSLAQTGTWELVDKKTLKASELRGAGW